MRGQVRASCHAVPEQRPGGCRCTGQSRPSAASPLTWCFHRRCCSGVGGTLLRCHGSRAPRGGPWGPRPGWRPLGSSPRVAPLCGFSSSSRRCSCSCPLPAQPGPALFPVSVLSPEPTPPSAAVASLCVWDTILLSPPVHGARRTSAGFGLFVPRMRFGEMIWQHDPASRTRNLRPAPLPSTAHWFPSCWAAVPRAGLGGAPRSPPASAPPRTPVQRMEGRGPGSGPRLALSLPVCGTSFWVEGSAPSLPVRPPAPPRTAAPGSY